MNENPLLKVPPESRGNRTRARFPSRRGGNLQEGGTCKLRPRDWYNAGSHRARAVRGVGVALVYLPAYWSELPSVVGVLCAVGRCVAGVVDVLLAAKTGAVAGALGGLRDGMVRLVGWDWIREALEGLLCD